MSMTPLEFEDPIIAELASDTVTTSDVLSGKTFHNSAGTRQTGTCSFDANTSDATAAASDILSGKTAYVNGSKVTGTHTDVTPTSITPSASAPAMTKNTVYKAAAAGYAINTYSTLTPSAAGVSIAKNTFYKASAAGYAINTYTSKTPAATGTSFSAGFIKMSAAGYAYTAQQLCSYAHYIISSGSPKTFTMRNGAFILRRDETDACYIGYVRNGAITNIAYKNYRCTVSYNTSTNVVSVSVNDSTDLDIFTFN